jgi:hypothetical protein
MIVLLLPHLEPVFPLRREISVIVPTIREGNVYYTASALSFW